MAMGVGMVAGLVIVGGWSLLTPWLVVALVLIALMMLVEYVRPWEQEAKAAPSATVAVGETGPSRNEQRALAGRLTILALFGIVAILMVTKPHLALVG